MLQSTGSKEVDMTYRRNHNNLDYWDVFLTTINRKENQAVLILLKWLSKFSVKHFKQGIQPKEYMEQDTFEIFVLYIRKWSLSVKSNSLRPHGLQPTRLLHPWDFPGKNTGVGFHFLLQEIFLTQGLNPSLPHCRQMFYSLSHQGSPYIRNQI